MPFPWKSTVLLACVAIAVATPVRAQSPSLQGTYALAGDGREEIDRAINQAIARMNFAARPIARGRLRKTNVPYRTIRIALPPGQVDIATDERAPVVSPANGAEIEWRREDGEVFRVSTRWESGALKQTFVAEDGKRVNVFTLSPDGNMLSMHVTVTSPRLDRPVTYTLQYRRQR